MNKTEIHTVARTVQRWRQGFRSGCKAHVLYNAGHRIAKLPPRTDRLSSTELAEWIRCLRKLGWTPKIDVSVIGPATWFPPKPKRKKRPRISK